MSGPLQGVTVLDMSRVLAGPLCAQTLADLGATVIKIENPQGGDELRNIGRGKLMHEGAPLPGQTSEFICVNRNKRSIAIDIAAPGGQALIRALAAKADVLIENYKVGNLARYGLDYESLRKVAPRLIYCSVTGYGQDGPLAANPGYDSVFQAMSGLMSITGDPSGEPQRVGAPIVDYLAGQNATIAILAALRRRDSEGGSGQHIDISLLESGIAGLTLRVQGYLVDGQTPKRIGNRIAKASPARVYDTANGQIVVSAYRDPDFRRLCEALNVLALTEDARFASTALRHQNEAALDETLEPAFAGLTTEAALGLLQQKNVICAPVNSIPDALNSPQIVSRDIVRTMVRPDGVEIRCLANPIRYSETKLDRYEAPPDLGVDTDAVLSDLLGMTEEELGALHRSGVLGKAPQ